VKKPYCAGFWQRSRVRGGYSERLPVDRDPGSDGFLVSCAHQSWSQDSIDGFGDEKSDEGELDSWIFGRRTLAARNPFDEAAFWATRMKLGVALDSALRSVMVGPERAVRQTS
jgi:hypothetical protein